MNKNVWYNDHVKESKEIRDILESRILFWSIIFGLSIIVYILLFVAGGPYAAWFLAGTHIGLAIFGLMSVSPFILIEAIGRKKGKNLSLLLLLPGSYFVYLAGSRLAFELTTDPSFEFVSAGVVLPLIIASLIVRISMKEKQLSWKIVPMVYLAVFYVSFSNEWYSEWSIAHRLYKSLTLEPVQYCEEGYFKSIEDAMENPLEVCVLRLSGEELTELPTEVAEFKNIKELDLIDTQISDLPPFVGGLKKLEKINFLRSDFAHVPRVLCELPNLREVGLLVGAKIPEDEIMGLYIAFPDIAVRYVGITDFQTKETIEQWKEYGIPSLCDPPGHSLYDSTLCTQEPEILANGRPVFPTKEEFAHLDFFGELFTASKCGYERTNRIFGVEDGQYTLKPDIYLKSYPSEDFFSVLRATGFTCSEEIASENECRHWTLRFNVPINDILIFEPYADEISAVGCTNCG